MMRIYMTQSNVGRWTHDVSQREVKKFSSASCSQIYLPENSANVDAVVKLHHRYMIKLDTRLIIWLHNDPSTPLLTTKDTAANNPK